MDGLPTSLPFPNFRLALPPAFIIKTIKSGQHSIDIPVYPLHQLGSIAIKITLLYPPCLSIIVVEFREY